MGIRLFVGFGCERSNREAAGWAQKIEGGLFSFVLDLKMRGDLAYLFSQRKEHSRVNR